jgi:plastocyanin
MRKTLIALLALASIGLLTGKSIFAAKAPVIISITANGYDDDNDLPTKEVSRGDTVWWVNLDTRPHSAMSDDGKSFDSTEIDSSKTKSVNIQMAPGNYPYHDDYGHVFKGVLIVK